MELFATPCPPNQCWAHRVYMTAFKKATILVTRVSLCHLLQHWVGGAWGAATALLDVDVVVFFSERGGQENACAASVWLCGVEVVPELFLSLSSYLLTCLLTYLLTYLLSFLLTYLLPSLLTYLLAYLLTRLLAYLLTCLLAYLLTW